MYWVNVISPIEIMDDRTNVVRTSMHGQLFFDINTAVDNVNRGILWKKRKSGGNIHMRDLENGVKVHDKKGVVIGVENVNKGMLCEERKGGRNIHVGDLEKDVKVHDKRGVVIGGTEDVLRGMWKLALPVIIYLCYVNNLINAQVQFRVTKQWKFINYTWPSEIKYANAVSSGLYIPENVIMAGINYYDDYFYVTMPRMKNGVPATLGRFTALQGFTSAPLVEPFPSWDFNKIADCDALQNVQNLEIDPNGIMYILDGGHTHSLMQNPVKNCPAQLVMFNIKTHQTVKTHVFPQNVASQSNSFLYDLVVDDEFVYITDNSATDPGIIVYSKEHDRSWKIRHPTMHGDAKAQRFTVNEEKIDVKINIAGIALGPKIQQTETSIVLNQDREVYYTSISSLHLYSISSAVLQNESNSNNGAEYSGMVRDVGVKDSQSDGIIMSNHGVMFYGLLSDNSIAQWDSSIPFPKGQKVLSRDANYIQWTNAFTIDTSGNLTVLSNTLQKFIHGPLDISRYNFWLLCGQIGQQSYLYDDPNFEYVPAPTTTTTSTTTTTTTMKSTTWDDSNEINGTIDGQKGDARQKLLEFSAVLIAITVWVFNYN
ncbi:hypothetical protein FQR65_LT10505 [Abscondita terminalis]|nr:hypothetical protein FQR65_LT10505 [Abscondita terminalis]